uniref:Uncharacterized protein n=1 Tax=Oryza brachyantha TaxID=4533 RepID=J3M8M0_ORYBR
SAPLIRRGLALVLMKWAAFLVAALCGPSTSLVRMKIDGPGLYGNLCWLGFVVLCTGP